MLPCLGHAEVPCLNGVNHFLTLSANIHALFFVQPELLIKGMRSSERLGNNCSFACFCESHAFFCLQSTALCAVIVVAVVAGATHYFKKGVVERWWWWWWWYYGGPLMTAPFDSRQRICKMFGMRPRDCKMLGNSYIIPICQRMSPLNTWDIFCKTVPLAFVFV